MDASLSISNSLKALLPWMVLIAVSRSRAFFVILAQISLERQ